MNENLMQYEIKITIKDLLKIWLNDKEYQLKKSTILKYKNIINLHIIPELGDIKLEDITYNTINLFLYNKSLTGRLNNNKALSKSYIKSMAIILSSALNYATIYGLSKPLIGKIIKPSITTPNIIALTKEEQSKLEQYLSKSEDYTELAIMLALNTGLRIGEICALSWNDIDLNNDILHVKNSVVRIEDSSADSSFKTKLIIDLPKSKHSIRDIPINSKLKMYLNKYDINNRNYYLLTSSNKFLSPRTLEYRFHKFLDKCNIKSFNFHVLRHTFATRCIECNVDIKTLSEIMGHSSVNITLNNYVHPSFENKRHQLEKLNDFG